MDKEYIMSIKGIELTNQVAEKVLRWVNKELDNGFGYPANFWVDENNVKKYPVNFFSPSSRLEDAWVIVEKFKDQLKLESWDGFLCEICTPFCVKAHATTAPEAICKAALLSVSGK